MKLTRFELEVLEVLWERSPASIREIHEGLPEARRPAYTTVQTIIRRLEAKGAVRQTKQIGNAHIFEPLVTRNAAHRRLVRDLLDVFGGSPRPLMAHLIEEGKVTLEDLKEIENLLISATARGKEIVEEGNRDSLHRKKRRKKRRKER